MSSKISADINKVMLVASKPCRILVLKVAHDLPVAGHFSNRKTEIKVCDQFWWPGISGDIRRYCQSCDQCQRMNVYSKARRAPLEPLPVKSTPLERVAVDIVGKISPLLIPVISSFSH